MIKLIVAKDLNNVIGKDNDLIWHLPADMRFFTESTVNHVVIMGRKNWDSIPDKYRPLKNRINVVVTRNRDFSHPDCETFHSIEEAIDAYRDGNKSVFIIGGGLVYKYVLDHNLVDEMLITYIDHEFEGDAFFPDFNESDWKKDTLMEYSKDEKNKYDFVVYRFTKKET